MEGCWCWEKRNSNVGSVGQLTESRVGKSIAALVLSNALLILLAPQVSKLTRAPSTVTEELASYSQQSVKCALGPLTIETITNLEMSMVSPCVKTNILGKNDRVGKVCFAFTSWKHIS